MLYERNDPMIRSFMLLLSASFCTVALAAEPVFSQDFSKVEAVPDELMVLSGELKIIDDGGNKVLALEPVPLDTYSFLFGPTAKEGLVVRARIKSAIKGRLAPTFGVGLGGVTGHVLRLAGTKKQLELVRDETVLASAASEWKSDTWLWFHLQVRPVDGAWMVEGKTWADGTPEPTAWQISFKEEKAPVSGRPSAWGMPYSGKPILFDDLTVTKLP
jgi:hypothetical protein